MFVLVDCESELIRDPSRGLEGGAFFLATLLNRKEVKAGKGKDVYDELEDFMLLKGDARFCQYLIEKYELNPDYDNTPDDIKKASPQVKEQYLHSLVSEALLDLLPYYEKCVHEKKLPDDYPLHKGRRASIDAKKTASRMIGNAKLQEASLLSGRVVSMTVDQIVNVTVTEEMIENSMDQTENQVSSKRKNLIFSCKLCSFNSKFKTLCKSHIETCLKMKINCPEITLASNNAYSANVNVTSADQEVGYMENEHRQSKETEIQDMFWNYKNAEFFLDSLIGVSGVYEKFGDGLGFFITNKILLPVFHGLRHSNYSCSIHRFITRILCEATPLEGSKLIHERFSNRVGKPGHNICRDRRMEYRIGVTKQQIGNLGGPNFSEESVMQTNKCIDIKEQLFYNTRKTHGVNIRKGRHNPRSDDKDYNALVFHLNETRAHKRLPGRTFGDIKYPANLLDDEKFNKSAFYRWLIQKNKEAKSELRAKK